jgi:hypothetical protein
MVACDFSQESVPELIEQVALGKELGMAKRSRATFQKREKEKARQQRQKEKEAKRLESREKGPGERRERGEGGEDPDIAGIRPGPQPKPWDDEEDEVAPDTD